MGCVPKTHRKQGKKLAQAAAYWASGQLDTTQDDDDDDTTQPITTALAAWGLQADATQPVRPDEKVFYLWPDCLPAWGLWLRIQTHWRVGMQGREGLATADLCAYLRDVERIRPRDFAATYRCLQAMETASLKEWAKQREQTK